MMLWSQKAKKGKPAGGQRGLESAKQRRFRVENREKKTIHDKISVTATVGMRMPQC